MHRKRPTAVPRFAVPPRALGLDHSKGSKGGAKNEIDRLDRGSVAEDTLAPDRESPLIPAASPGSTTDGLALLSSGLAVCWMGGTLLLLVPLLAGHFRIGRLRWQANMADVEVFEQCQAIARAEDITAGGAVASGGQKARCRFQVTASGSALISAD